MNTNPENARIVEADASSFEAEVLKSKQPVLVAFWAPWSQPCHILDSVLGEVAVACAGRVAVIKVNADDNPDLSMWYEIQSIPALLFFHESRLRAKIIGTASKEAILAKLQTIISDSHSPPLAPGTKEEHGNSDL